MQIRLGLVKSKSSYQLKDLRSVSDGSFLAKDGQARFGEKFYLNRYTIQPRGGSVDSDSPSLSPYVEEASVLRTGSLYI